MADWQPIETAPKDGTDILVYRPKANKYVPKVGVDWLPVCQWDDDNEAEKVRP
jgi:hypothetical protein